MKDKFEYRTYSFDAPSQNAWAITPHDTTDENFVSRAIYVGTGGDVVAVMKSTAVVTFKNVLGGTILPVRVQRVNATGTTATDMVGLE